MEALAAWTASEVVNYIYIKFLFTLRERVLRPARVLASAAHIYLRALRRSEWCRDPLRGTFVVLQFRIATVGDFYYAADRAFRNARAAYAGYRDFLCSRLGLPPGTRWGPLVAAVRRGGRRA